MIKSLACLAFVLPFGMNAIAEVYHVSQTAAASDKNPGLLGSPFKTINRAARAAKAGDTVIVHEGVYREWAMPENSGTPDSPITYMGSPGEKVVVSGSEKLKLKWEVLPGNNRVSKADIQDDVFPANHLLPGRVFNPFKIQLSASDYRPAEERFAEPKWDKNGEGQLVVGEVYVKGIPLTQVRTTAEVIDGTGTYCVANQGKTLVVNFFKWSGPEIEVSARPYAFAPRLRGVSYIKVKGFIFEHATNAGTYPGSGMVSVRSGHHWTIEDNVVRYCGMSGLDIGSEVIAHGTWGRVPKNRATDINEGTWAPGVEPPLYELSQNRQEEMLKKLPRNKVQECLRAQSYMSADAPSHGHVVRNNRVHDCGLTGVCMPKCDDSLIVDNVVERCNRRKISTDWGREIAWNECAGMKALCAKRLTIKGNIVRDNLDKGSAIWFDCYCSGNTVDGNIALNNYYGIYLEACAASNEQANVVCNNIAMFNRIDGFNSTESTTPTLIAHNLFAYNGRWGCAAIDGDRWGKDNSPVAFKVCNNIFVGNQQGAFRLPLLDPVTGKGNCFSGNVFLPGTVFQTAVRSKDKPAAAKMIDEMKGYLRKANVTEANWPDFSTWQVENRWYCGLCGYQAFQSAISATGNVERSGLNVRLYELMDRFRYGDAEGHPVGEHLFHNIVPGYIMTYEGWSDLKVKPVPEVKTDFLGNVLDKDAVVPGPFQIAKDKGQVQLALPLDKIGGPMHF